MNLETLFIGQRVNVENNPTETWDSKKTLFNGIVTKVDAAKGIVHVVTDDKTTYSSNYTFKGGGMFILGNYYSITPSN